MKCYGETSSQLFIPSLPSSGVSRSQGECVEKKQKKLKGVTSRKRETCTEANPRTTLRRGATPVVRVKKSEAICMRSESFTDREGGREGGRVSDAHAREPSREHATDT